MINGVQGNMGRLTAKYLYDQEDMELVRGVDPKGGSISCLAVAKTIEEGVKTFCDIVVDFTVPDAVNANAEIYCQHNLPFVMGTTGGDRERLIETVKNSNISAVIAPNMAKQIVGFQAMMEYAAKQFPGLFAGYSLKIKESHQEGKKDTSGTAKAMVSYFNELGISFDLEEIVKIRHPKVQQFELRVPEEFLDGHGWHTYTLFSPDQTVKFEFTHNVNGRDVYALGTLDAIRFLHRKIQEGSKGEVFSMINVLKS